MWTIMRALLRLWTTTLQPLMTIFTIIMSFIVFANLISPRFLFPCHISSFLNIQRIFLMHITLIIPLPLILFVNLTIPHIFFLTLTFHLHNFCLFIFADLVQCFILVSSFLMLLLMLMLMMPIIIIHVSCL